MPKSLELTWREVFKELLCVQREIYTPELAGDDFDEAFRPGLIHGLFVKRDPRLVGSVFDALTARLDSPDFRDQVVALYRSRCEHEVRDTDKKNAQSKNPDVIRDAVIRDRSERISNVSWTSFSDYCEKLYEGCWPSLHPNLAGDSYFRQNHLLSYVAGLIFEHLSRHEGCRFIVPKDSLLASEYANAGIDLFQCDAEFNAYGLLTVTSEMQFSLTKPLEPFDTRVSKYLTLDADRSTVHELVTLYKEGLIGKLSFRPCFNIGLRSGTSLNLAMEELERGTLFELSGLNRPEVTKLYSKEYDTLWVKTSKGDLTFEELVQNFVIEGDDIVTQVVHLQHSKKNGVDYISHIDHEYIYYTVEEYDARQINPDQKGGAHRRIKTFKVDNAKIPFTLSDGRWFLYVILERHFKNAELVREYFQKVL